MSFRKGWSRCLPVWLVVAGLVLQPLQLHAGHQFLQNRGVGGISINAAGVVTNFDPASRKLLLNELRKNVARPAGEINRPSGLRMISLKGLNAAVQHAMSNNLGQLPDEVRYLAGIQRIKYVFLYPEQNDIVLAGPGEGWRVTETADVVGITTGRPVLQLDHLVTALRYVRQLRGNAISCSIDPTAEGYRKLQAVLNSSRRSGNRRGLESRMKAAFGPQQITVQGIPASSRFARVLVAADYKMKRLAMNLDRSAVKGMPSFVEMIRNQRVSTSLNPRWWLACNYQPVARNENGLAWEIRGQGVKAMTENDFVDENGNVARQGTKDKQAQKWADTMTEKYEELAVKDPVFGELRNVMDMTVVAALLEQHQLLEKANCSIPLLASQKSEFEIGVWNAPKAVAPQCSFLKAKNGWIVTASGGVELNPWDVTGKADVNPKLSGLYKKAGHKSAKQWWWN